MTKILNVILVIFIASILFQSCSNSKSIVKETRTLDTLIITPEKKVYQASAKRKHDLIHTELHVSFDWENQFLNGKATITLKPYFHSTVALELDAKGFDIHKVSMKDGKDLSYQYDSLMLAIQLDKEYSRTDTFSVYIEYTAKPNELEQRGSAAIRDAKGLYFINPLNEEKGKPQQIWTQGETESSSCWFPTIDKPNEKMTQEIYITVKDKYKTLSNGELVYQEENGDGTRTDYWKQHKPHTPYLAMMAIGEFAIVEDSWRDSIEVNYFVEHEYEKYAQEIFGHTPEMMEFFSKKLGVDYPWYKYHQVVVRDYVSGAMENTSAVIHGEFLHQTTREMIDGDNQDIIAHELFHHWFGDLVTCESWANLPLNESFATYGEYLWREYKHGRESADKHLDGDLRSYLRESKYKKEDMIRFDYEDKEDMFDSHSYAKGGRILHMLRYYVGDDAFFEGLRFYLNENAFETAEIHDLRIAFEKITGEDLNWFFNQWFLSAGHPILNFSTSYNDSLKEVEITIKQEQDLTISPIYQLPISVDFYTANGIKRETIIISEKVQTVKFSFETKPKLINIDADKMLLCEKTEDKSMEEWIYQYNNAPLYIDRKEALNNLRPFIAENEEAFITVLSSLNDENENLRKQTINVLEEVALAKKDEVEALLIKISKEDQSSLVRANALAGLGTYYNDSLHSDIYAEALNDSSYMVMYNGLVFLSKVNSKKAIYHANLLKGETNKLMIRGLIEVFGTHGDDTAHEYFIDASKKISGYGKYSFIPSYVDYLSRNNSVNNLKKAIPILKSFSGGDYFNQFYNMQLSSLSSAIEKEQNVVATKLQQQEDSDEKLKLEELNVELNEIKKELDDFIKELKG